MDKNTAKDSFEPYSYKAKLQQIEKMAEMTRKMYEAEIKQLRIKINETDTENLKIEENHKKTIKKLKQSYEKRIEKLVTLIK